MKDAKGHGSEAHGAHAEGVNQIGQPKLNSYGLPHVDWKGDPLPDTAPHSLYVGMKKDVIAETRAPDFYHGKYYVYPVADNGNLDVEGASSKKSAEGLIKAYREFYPNIRVVRI
jgi:hypothetical protein